MLTALLLQDHPIASQLYTFAGSMLVGALLAYSILMLVFAKTYRYSPRVYYPFGPEIFSSNLGFWATKTLGLLSLVLFLFLSYMLFLDSPTNLIAIFVGLAGLPVLMSNRKAP